jgi:hypothetical protein
MENELIPDKSWWKKNWKWILTLAAIILFGCGISLIISQINAVKKERENGIGFDLSKWNTDHDPASPQRNKMIKDLIAGKKLKHLKKDQIISLLGPPDRVDSVYLFYKITQQHLGFFALHTSNLVIKLSDGSKENAVMIHE